MHSHPAEITPMGSHDPMHDPTPTEAVNAVQTTCSAWGHHWGHVTPARIAVHND